MATTDTPLEQLERRERRTQFYQALDALNERQRRVLVLFELEEMSVAEISAPDRAAARETSGCSCTGRARPFSSA